MGSLSAEERPIIGQLANEVRAEIEKKIESLTSAAKEREKAEKLKAEKLDVTIPGEKTDAGHLHQVILLLQVQHFFQVQHIIYLLNV